MNEICSNVATGRCRGRRLLSGLAILTSSLAVLVCAGCAEIRIGTSKEPIFEMEGLGTAYVTATGVPEYDGTILRANILRGGAHTGEIASASVWPLAELGIGVLGIRARVVMLEAAVGTLLYQPRSSDVSKSAAKEHREPKPKKSEPAPVEDKDKEDL